MDSLESPLVQVALAAGFRWAPQAGLIALEESSDNKNEVDECKETPNFMSFGYKNMIEMLPGDVGAVMRYVQEKQAEDPSFYYALQLDQNEKLSCIFWADVDATYRSRDYGRPFAPFVGVNNHKQMIIFGAALLYGESEESFRWLFETFKTAISGKQPNVVLTDRCEAMRNAVAAVRPGTTHRVCVWHMYNDALKHLNLVCQGSTTFAKDFRRCKEDFVLEWMSLVEKYDLGSNSWLNKLYMKTGRRGLWHISAKHFMLT